MRTAVTLAKTHKGDWKIVSSPDVPLIDQHQAFRKRLGDRVDPELAEIRMQEDDGHVRRIVMRSPEAHAEHEKLRAAEAAKFNAAQEADSKAAEDAKKAEQAKRELLTQSKKRSTK